jgi:hypothetical protein
VGGGTTWEYHYEHARTNRMLGVTMLGNYRPDLDRRVQAMVVAHGIHYYRGSPQLRQYGLT